MTKQEFIQEAALRILKYGEPVDAIADYLKRYADAIFEVCEEQKPETHGLTADEPIENLIHEINRLDEERIRQEKEDFMKRHGHECYFQKSGYAEKVRRTCKLLDFKHVANLIGFGRVAFRGQRNVGEKTCKVVDKAMKNLYNIDTW